MMEQITYAVALLACFTGGVSIGVVLHSWAERHRDSDEGILTAECSIDLDCDFIVKGNDPALVIYAFDEHRRIWHPEETS